MTITYEIGHVMNRDILTMDSTADLTAAAELMIKKGIGSLVITEKGEMAGMITERDILKHFPRAGEMPAVKVKVAMSTPLVTVDSRAPIGHAADIMAKKRIRRLLVTQADQIVGIVTERDIMRATLDVFNKLTDALV